MTGKGCNSRTCAVSSSPDPGIWALTLLYSLRAEELEKLIRAQAAGNPAPERFLGWRKGIITDQLMGAMN